MFVIPLFQNAPWMKQRHSLLIRHFRASHGTGHCVHKRSKDNEKVRRRRRKRKQYSSFTITQDRENQRSDRRQNHAHVLTHQQR